MNFLRENLAAVRYELWSMYWFVRCKLAADSARFAIVLGDYCRWRGKRAWVALWFARRFVGLARWLVPPALRPLTEAVCEGEI